MSFPLGNTSTQTTGLMLRCARIIRGIRIKDLAEEIHVHPSYLSLIETGRRRVTPELALRLTRAFSLPQSSETR